MKHVSLAVAVCFVALVAAWPALANAITLACSYNGQTFTTAVDLTNNTAENYYPAAITPTTIDWQFTTQPGQVGANGVIETINNHIDRTTGVYTVTITNQGKSVVQVASCTLNGAARF